MEPLADISALRTRGELYVRLGRKLMQIGELQLTAARQIESVAPEMNALTDELCRLLSGAGESCGSVASETQGVKAGDQNPDSGFQKGVNDCAALYLSVSVGSFIHKKTLLDGVRLLGASVKSVGSLVSSLSQDRGKRFKSDGKGGWALKTPEELLQDAVERRPLLQKKK